VPEDVPEVAALVDKITIPTALVTKARRRQARGQRTGGRRWVGGRRVRAAGAPWVNAGTSGHCALRPSRPDAAASNRQPGSEDGRRLLPLCQGRPAAPHPTPPPTPVALRAAPQPDPTHTHPHTRAHTHTHTPCGVRRAPETRYRLRWCATLP
jgi:hypothetical protein